MRRPFRFGSLKPQHVELIFLEPRLRCLAGGWSGDRHRRRTMSCIITFCRSRTRASQAPLARRVIRRGCAIRA
jgi:hypothetical protein